ncbi:YtxH domain-containing protein [Flavobacterium sp. I-SCBP12n]|uniref:YtxH domain-containing protein n=2 Tax=Flavobacterium TaxID=237 RepID=A0A9X1XZ90_9FLAO|nr:MULTISPECIES: YtxH domain-containing protein [Flavobacterium]MBP4142189.1 YtxH domain-containing protein [Flavobacterium flabelliforme]MCK8142422.1 YtxH domain-containing protein [Flavobacterium pygoscelis]
MKADKVILGVLGGVAVGALLGVLFAPEKGDKTRRKIMDKSNDYAEELKDKLDSLLGSISNKYEKIWKEGESLLADGKSKLNDAKKEGEDLLAEGKSKYYEAKSEIKNS